MAKKEDSMDLDSQEGNLETKSNKDGMTEMDNLLNAIAELDKKSAPLDEPIDVDTPPANKKRKATALKPTICENPVDLEKDGVMPPHVPATIILKPVSLASFYKFDGVTEFIMKDAEHHNARYAVRTAFEEHPKSVGFGEIDLHRCRNWYNDLRCAAIIDNPKDGDVTWYFRLIIINPSAPQRNFHKNLKYASRVAKFKELVFKFYSNGFTAGEPTASCIKMALEHEVTIMIVAKKMKTPPTEWKNMWEEKNVGLKIVGAITFSRTTASRKQRADVAVFISWLLIAKHDSVHPSQTDGWRRQGFGLFMIIAMIKYCFGESKEFAKTVDVFLQCVEPSAFHFYSMLGFKQLNTHFDDGYAMLPLHVRAYLSATSNTSSKKNVAMFHFYETKDDNNTTAYKLMHLPSGVLRHFIPDPLASSQSVLSSSSRARWCAYPPLDVRDKSFQFPDSSMRQLFFALLILKDLLPGPYSNVPKGVTKTAVKGEMYIERRLKHTNDNGTSWMASGEVDLMFAILCFDRRYQDLCFIMPSCDCTTIALTFKAYQQYQRALKIAALAPDPSKINDAIKERFGTTLEGLAEYFRNMRNHLVERVIDPNAGMLERRLIVFPCNENSNHWSATFVFNASFINVSADAPEVPNGLRPCFFRYCSMDPNGTRHVPHSQGIVWFLNLCVSYEGHAKKNANLEQSDFEWLDPFGASIEGNMQGTASFPALRLPAKSMIFPRQDSDDTYNCGFGVTAATAMILRDLAVHSDFDVLFSKTTLTFETCPVTKEVYCAMPDQELKPCCSTIKPPIVWQDYLSRLRVQWFIVFDRLAEMQYAIEPTKVFDDWEIPDAFAKAKTSIVKWPAKPAGMQEGWEDAVGAIRFSKASYEERPANPLNSGMDFIDHERIG